MSLAKVSTTVKYKVPAWNHCNMQGNVFGQPSKEKCRFCVKEKGYYRCALYNTVLSSEGPLVNKTRDCEKATAGFNIVVEDEQAPSVPPKTIMKHTLAEYRKVYNQLINQGYPEAMADRLAQEYILGGA